MSLFTQRPKPHAKTMQMRKCNPTGYGHAPGHPGPFIAPPSEPLCLQLLPHVQQHHSTPHKTLAAYGNSCDSGLRADLRTSRHAQPFPSTWPAGRSLSAKREEIRWLGGQTRLALPPTNDFHLLLLSRVAFLPSQPSTSRDSLRYRLGSNLALARRLLFVPELLCCFSSLIRHQQSVIFHPKSSTPYIHQLSPDQGVLDHRWTMDKLRLVTSITISRERIDGH